MKKVALVALVLLLSAAAGAQPVPTAAPAPLPEEPAVRVGGELSLLPFGTLEGSAAGMTLSEDMAVATGVGLVLQHPIYRVFTFELAPRMLFHVKGDDDERSMTELDMRARITVGSYATPQLRVFAALEPGYSFLFLPDAEDVPAPNGPTLGFGGGMELGVAAKTKMTVQVGYQLGFQQTRVLGNELGLETNLLHFTLGLLVDL